MLEEQLVRELRQGIDEAIPKEVGKLQKVSRDEALSEAEYVFKRRLAENRPTNMEEAGQILNDTFKMIYAYLKSVGYDIPPKEMMSHLLKEK